MKKTNDERIDRCRGCGNWRWDKHCAACQGTWENR